MEQRHRARLTLLSLVVGMWIVLPNAGPGPWAVSNRSAGAPRTVVKTTSDKYAYNSDCFACFVTDSYRYGAVGETPRFREWMNRAYVQSSALYPGKETLSLGEVLRWKRHELRDMKDPVQRTDAEIATAAWVHKLIKATIPRFSLDRGFEFQDTVKLGERQCFLQSVLVSSIVQEMGINAGIAMVYKNTHGQVTNNGHAVVLVKLPSGEDLIVDASEPEPFARQHGLFVRTAGYRYVDPVYATDSFKITSYRAASGGETLSPAQVKPLDVPFIRSQFWYYRGERAIGGPLSHRRTALGMQTSANALRKSVELCPKNPLSVYMLGRVYLSMGKIGQAREHLVAARKLYSDDGWVPAGATEFLNLANRLGAAHPKA